MGEDLKYDTRHKIELELTQKLNTAQKAAWAAVGAAAGAVLGGAGVALVARRLLAEDEEDAEGVKSRRRK